IDRRIVLAILVKDNGSSKFSVDKTMAALETSPTGAIESDTPRKFMIVFVRRIRRSLSLLKQ
ncbi:unnamed protein product, partial [Rotaria magnacalcarata]